MFSSDADAGILHAEPHSITGGIGVHHDLSTSWGIVQRMSQPIDQHLQDAMTIDQHQWEMWRTRYGKRDTVRRTWWSQAGECSLDPMDRCSWFQVSSHLV
jgi:hypothetical protein